MAQNRKRKMDKNAQNLTEKDIEKAVVKYAREKGILVLKLWAKGKKGFPDRTFLTEDGRAFFIEFKTPNGKVSRHQDYVIRDLADRGFYIYLVDSVDFGKKVIDINIEEQ